MRQLAGQTNAELVWTKSNSLKRCTPTPISPRRYQPPVNSCTMTGWIGCGAMIGGRSAALAEVNAAAIVGAGKQSNLETAHDSIL